MGVGMGVGVGGIDVGGGGRVAVSVGDGVGAADDASGAEDAAVGVGLELSDEGLRMMTKRIITETANKSETIQSRWLGRGILSGQKGR
jgi:hypothetical protein